MTIVPSNALLDQFENIVGPIVHDNSQDYRGVSTLAVLATSASQIMSGESNSATPKRH